MAFSLSIKHRAQKMLAKIPANKQQKIIAAIYELADIPFPSGCKKLTGREAWRIRVGDYRVIYEVENERLTIFIIEIGHRREIYRKI
ncbi:MAG: type II toxin-antitoxin system RelE/ParE family toxin [Methylococcales bacterium]|jgi:mRNA interferase RelE/StbE|nr:type II toxin-antitoxin system RelE/ParE family toxin [Methylococcales bacterium]